MKTSTAGLMALVCHEGIVRTRYRDSVGVWTLGIGHTAAAGAPDPKTFTGALSISEAFELLRVDIVKYEAGVNRAVKVPLKPHEFDALVSFHFNTGAIAKASLTRLLNAGDKAGAAKAFMNYSKPAEIIPRREAEQALFKTGEYPAPFANVYPAMPAGKVLWGRGQRIDLRKHLAAEPAKPVEPAPKPAEMAPVEPIKPPVTQEPPKPEPRPEPAAPGKAGIFALIAAAVLAVLAWLAALPCNLFGAFCQ